ncbi:retrovirus-related pol polyprotein from transposon TNT 1-94 [Tanacetum coccineum]
MLLMMQNQNQKEFIAANLPHIADAISEAQSFNQAFKDQNWRDAMTKEIQALFTLLLPGKTPIEGRIDYTETFALVAKMPTVRTLIAIAVQNGWPIQQLDVNNAFLNGDLNEEVYMTVPQGYPHSLPPNTVCKCYPKTYPISQQ